MAEDTEEFEGEEPEFKSIGGGLAGFLSGRKRLLLLIVLPTVLVIGVGAAVYFTGLAAPILALFSKKPAVETAATDLAPAKEKASSAPAQEVAPVTFQLPDILVNTNTPGRVKSFLKLTVVLILNNVTDTDQVTNASPHIVDSFQLYLRDLKPEDLTGAAGVFRLREELLNRVNAAVRPVQVKDVLFKEFIVQ